MTHPAPKSTLVNNFLSLSGAEVISKILTLATFAFVARVVGPAGFGYLEFAYSVVMCGALIVDQGSSVYGPREIARAPDSTTRLITEVTSLRLTMAIVVYAGFVLLVWSLERPAFLEHLILLIGLTVFLMPFMLQWVFQGHDQMRTVGLLQIVRQAVFAIVVFTLLRNPESLSAVAIGELGGAAAVVVLSLWLTRTQLGLSIPLKFHFSAGLLRAAATIGLGQLFWSLRMYGSIIMVGLIATEAEVGFFGAAMRIAISLNAFVWLYFFNLLPSMSRLWKRDHNAFQHLIDQSLRTVGWLALAGGMLWVLLAPTVIRFVYGAQFMAATATLQLMSALIILGIVHGHFRFGLIAADCQRFATASAGLGTLVALGMIPFCYGKWGIFGATIALLAGEFMVWGSSFFFSQRKLDLQGPHRHLIRPAMTAVALVAVLWLLPQATPTIGRIAVTVVALVIGLYVSEERFRAAIRQRTR
jgi:PST family polysaccharide transporter